jgi:hypothetical protein
VDANPKPIYTWNKIAFDLKGSEEKIPVGNSANLTFTAGPDAAGRYECIASVPGNDDVTARASVFLKGPPKIFTDTRDQVAKINFYSSSLTAGQNKLGRLPLQAFQASITFAIHIIRQLKVGSSFTCNY